jgi:hypothetical protein
VGEVNKVENETKRYRNSEMVNCVKLMEATYEISISLVVLTCCDEVFQGLLYLINKKKYIAHLGLDKLPNMR